MADKTEVCKICGGDAPHWAIIDFNRSCEDWRVMRRGRTTPFFYNGIEVHYYRCADCQFLFTPFFDDWSVDRWRRAIYNGDYERADPEGRIARPARTAERLLTLFPKKTILDYGGGSGITATLLRCYGVYAHSYDPITGFDLEPNLKYDVVSCVEVLEHAADPFGLISDLVRFLNPGGVVRFTTHLQPERVRPDWWYIAPRNGHVSIFSERSLTLLWKHIGFEVTSDEGEGKFFARPVTVPLTGQKSELLEGVS